MSKHGENLPDLIEEVQLYSVQAEMASLGACLLSERAMADLAATMEPSDFVRPAHRLIFQAMKGLFERGVVVDEVTLETELLARGTMASVGGPDYLMEIGMYVPSAANSEHYAGIVKEKEARRAAVMAAREIEEAAKTNRPLKEIEQMGLGLAARLTLGERRKPDISWSELVRGQDGRPDPGAVPTGNEQLDSLLAYNGLTNGQITLSTAPTGGGKSTWMFGVIFAACDRGKRCAILNFADNNENDLLERALRYKCGYRSLKAADRDYEGDERGERQRRVAMFKRAQEEIEAWDLEVFDAASNDEQGTFEAARAWLIRKCEEGLARFVPKRMEIAGWDYIQTIDVGDRDVARRPFYDQQSWLAKRTGKLCASLDFPFVMCGQLTEKEGGKEVLAECKVWEKVCENHFRIHENGVEIRKRRRGGKTAVMPAHKYHPQRWCFVPENRNFDHAIQGGDL